MSSDITSLVDKATSALLLDIDWDTTLQIVDLIRQGDITPKNAVSALLGKIHDSNPNVVILALQVLESVVKNCGQVVHEHIATRDFMEEIRDLLKRSSNEDVQKRIMLLLAAWVYAFRSEPKYRAVQDTVNILKAEGYKIPTVIESDAMFTADTAPDWADGECCHRCRSHFTMIRRKHHCRACGQVFCSDCSNKSSTIPKFGIEREVRVCDYCYEDINNSSPRIATAKNDLPTLEKNAKPPSNPNKKSAEELQEEEELQLALALSKSEAENKEKEKLRATSNLLGVGWRNNQQGPKLESVQVAEKEENDPELAKYLNRSFWEQQKQKQKNKVLETEVQPPIRTHSPSIPSAPSNLSKVGSISKTNEFIQNGGMEEIDDFVSSLRSQLEIFVNRMKSNQSRGRPIANDTAVQSLFMNITAMHAQLLTYIQDQDRKRVHCEQLQDKISQIRDARAALDALREEHREKIRREKEEQERIRQIQMMQKLEIMRKKKQEYLEYQRQLALHRMAESERQILSGQHPSNIPSGGGGGGSGSGTGVNSSNGNTTSGGGQSGYATPIGFPQGYPPQPQLGGYVFSGQSENPPNQGIVPSYQSTIGPTPSGQPGINNYAGPPPPNLEYGAYTMAGSGPGMGLSPQNYGPAINSPPGGPSPQVTQPSETPQMMPQSQPPPSQEEDETQLISFD